MGRREEEAGHSYQMGSVVGAGQMWAGLEVDSRTD